MGVNGGTAYSGAIVTRYYDQLHEKAPVWVPSSEKTLSRTTRSIREYRIRGFDHNLQFLEAILAHPKCRAQTYTTTFIDETPEFFEMVARKDGATKLLTFIADEEGEEEAACQPQNAFGTPIVNQLGHYSRRLRRDTDHCVRSCAAAGGDRSAIPAAGAPIDADARYFTPFAVTIMHVRAGVVRGIARSGRAVTGFTCDYPGSTCATARGTRIGI